MNHQTVSLGKYWKLFPATLTSDVLILIHSDDACILVMACVDCARAYSEKPWLLW